MTIRSLAVVLFFLASSQSSGADTIVDVTDEYAFGPEMSQNEACDKAVVKAKNRALRRVVGEKITNSQIESCTDDGSDFNCTLFEDTFSFLDSGYITDTSEFSQTVRTEAGASVCTVSFKATVGKISGVPDPEFRVTTEIMPGVLLRDGEELQVVVSPTKPSYVYLLGWYPEFKKDSLVLLSKQHKFHDKLARDKVTFPDERHKLVATMPPDSVSASVSEFLVVLIAKSKIALGAEISRKDFFALINDLPRRDWAMNRVSYKIVRKD